MRWRRDEVARGVVTEHVAQGFLGGVVERLAAVHPAQAALQLLDRLQAIHDAHRLVERELLVAEERVALTEVAAIGEQLETAHQLGELRLQVRVAEGRGDHLLELVAHLRRQRLHERVHARHLSRELREELVERGGRFGEHRAPLLQEVLVVVLQLRVGHALELLAHQCS